MRALYRLRRPVYQNKPAYFCGIRYLPGMTQKRGRGRPKGSFKENPRTVRRLIKLTKSEAASLDLNCERLGLNWSDAIRDAMRSYGLLPRA